MCDYAGKIWGKDEKVYVPHRHTQKTDAGSNAVGSQILPSNMLVSSNAPGLCSFVRIDYKIFWSRWPRLAASLCRADGPCGAQQIQGDRRAVWPAQIVSGRGPAAD
ncbi:hypothetical protein GGP65_001749 [Salinibacter ruber]|uniref:Uncharacterized protein n=1 Tax=Salinibacter ruber TaxID=146919 RepID=A0AAW5P406_9BACT|nr:hypothetical protein [Salinibacter ruber]MCS4156707.1 hypothetical protein [Salinibacter ruber]MCS4222650.1 hypothetical protein [Salinibacter ruber]